MYAFLLWNIVLTLICARLLWNVGNLECKVRKLEIDFNQFDKEFAKKINDIRTNSAIIAKCLEWRKQNETTTEEESL